MAPEYKIKKQLKKLSGEQFEEDIKKFIKSSHEFYSSRVPELKILANKLHEEHDLKEFYKVFNKFWNSGHPREVSLAIYTLQLYKEEFDLDTWKFVKSRFKELKSWDKIDAIGSNVVGEILIKFPELEIELLEYSNGKNMWLKRLALMSTIPNVRKNDIALAMKMIEANIYLKSEYMYKPIGVILKEIGENRPDFLRKFVLKNINMPIQTFIIATEDMRELRKLREVHRPVYNNIQRLKFWKS